MRVNMQRDLPKVGWRKRHGHTLSIAAGGPSLADTYQNLTGYIAAVNGSLGFLLDKGIVPDACGVLDPGEQMTDIVRADHRVRYFVASICHPSLFDKLEECAVHIWCPSGEPLIEDELSLEPDWFAIGGGCTMGIRWLNLGYVCGFRKFELHGVDSSFRDTGSHAYADSKSGQGYIQSGKYQTRPEFLSQASDFFAVLERFAQPDMEPVSIEVHGDGMLPDIWAKYRKMHPDAFKC